MLLEGAGATEVTCHLVWERSRWTSSEAVAGPDGPLLTLDKQAFRIYCEEKQGGPGYKRPLERFKCAPL